MLDESSVRYDAASGLLQFRVRANLKLTGARDVASVSIAIPSDLEKGSAFTYEIPCAWAETRSNDLLNYCEGFALTNRWLSVEAPYTLTVDDLYVGMTEKATFLVKDHTGNVVQNAQIFDANQGFIGLSNWRGQFTVPGSLLTAPGNYVFYASGDLGCSFPVQVTVAENMPDLESELTFRAQANPSGNKTVSWISSVHDTVYLRWAKTPQALNQAEIHEVSFSRLTFGSAMAQINTYTITELNPGEAGYLQISYDQKDWSVMEHFYASDFGESTHFSVMGSLSSAEHDRLQTMLEMIVGQTPQMAVQIGDAVQDAASVAEWTERLGALDALESADLLLVPGEKTAGRTASAVAVQPENPYSYEYGSVYFAVIPGAVNSAALDWLARDAAQSKCLWKVLLTAAPIVESDRAVLEQAGIHVAISDGSYSRTPALSAGKTVESYDENARTSIRGDGIVYITCGDPAKEPVFLSAEATQSKLVIHAWDGSDGEAKELDSFTMLSSSCAEEGHSFGEQSQYNHDTGTIVCDRCGLNVSAKETGYTGFVSMEEGRAYLDHGTARTGWFYAAGTLLHAGSDARVHQTMDFSTETCTEDGVHMAWCVDCRMTRSYGTTVAASGHHYDEKHHCTNTHFDAAHKSYACGWIGVRISSLNAELEYLYGYYSGASLMPTVTIKTGDGAELDAKEYTVTYVNNTKIGMAHACITGVNSYYGELELPFEIRPCDVETIHASEVGQTRLVLSWDEAPGAQRYAIYQQTGSGWKRLGDTAELTYTVTGLSPAALYTFRVRPFAAAEFTGKRLDGSLDRTFWAAHHSQSLSVRTEGVRFVDVPEWEWYAAPVQWAVDQNITNGTDLNLFSPESNCTRGQMVTFLWRAKGCPEPNMRSSPFSDVNNPDEYYYKAVLWAVEQGITRGSSLTTFSPDAPVTR
ncbi:MAG: S-layer homology domain-containing protein, partial [Oscillospiraceae bacterium]|nr:S-layer homology domain-containing protein [Oscillospiraceae bacterium]